MNALLISLFDLAAKLLTVAVQAAAEAGATHDQIMAAYAAAAPGAAAQLAQLRGELASGDREIDAEIAGVPKAPAVPQVPPAELVRPEAREAPAAPASAPGKAGG